MGRSLVRPNPAKPSWRKEGWYHRLSTRNLLTGSLLQCISSKPQRGDPIGIRPNPAKSGSAGVSSLNHDIESVLEGMIFHPRNHAHADKLGIVSELADAPVLPPSEIRLAGGIENAFAFLTHLRYQFCLLSEDARQVEQTRLSRLFASAIREHRTTVPAAELFDFKAYR